MHDQPNLDHYQDVPVTRCRKESWTAEPPCSRINDLKFDLTLNLIGLGIRRICRHRLARWMQRPSSYLLSRLLPNLGHVRRVVRFRHFVKGFRTEWVGIMDEDSCEVRKYRHSLRAGVLDGGDIVFVETSCTMRGIEPGRV